MRSSVVECVASHADAQPETLAVADHAHALTYRQLWEAITCFAQRLQAENVHANSYVLIECDQSVEFLVGVLAAHLICAIAVPIEKNAARSRIVEISNDTDACLFIGKSPIEELQTVAFIPLSGICAEHVAQACQEPSFPTGEDVAEILFSTGTTGKSKGIVITHANNIAIAENIICGVKMKPDNVEIVPMPLSHSHGLRTAYANLVNGSSTILTDGVLALKRMFDLMDAHHVTSIDISPSMLSIIFKLSKDRIGSYADELDYVQLGSAPLPEQDKQQLRQLLPHTRLYNFYGSTEAGRSCLFDFATMEEKPGCIGKPAVNARFIVVDENRKPIESSIEHPGFLASSGPINMRCYFKAPELTAETMSDGFIYTKDLGYIDEDGLIYMLGRKDDVINFGGVKVSPEEIESVVAKHPDVNDCACIPIPDAVSGQVPLLCIRLESGREYDARSFKKFLSTSIDANKQPQRVEIVDEIPRTFNGKIKRKELISRYA